LCVCVVCVCDVCVCGVCMCVWCVCVWCVCVWFVCMCVCVFTRVWIAQSYSDSLRAGRPGDRIPVGTRFSAPVQTGRVDHPASYTMCTGSSRVQSGWRRGVDYPPPFSYTSTPPYTTPTLGLRGWFRVKFTCTVLYDIHSRRKGISYKQQNGERLTGLVTSSVATVF